MRESLTIFAIAVILVLSALLVGPYLIDWSNQRVFLAARLSKAVGAKVSIAGPIDVKLLPRPIFRVAQVTIEGAGPDEPRVTVQTLDAELSINGLLQGSIEFVDATVLSPRLEITMRGDGSVIGPPMNVRDPQAFQFQHVNISDGAIVIRDETGAERLTLGGLNAQAEATSLAGPLKASGSIEQRGQRLAFRLSTGTYAAQRLRVKLILDGSGALAHADADGALTFTPHAAGARPLPGFEGGVSLSGALHVADGAAPVPWRAVVTGVKTDKENITGSAIELRAGFDGRALVANGSGSITLGSSPAAVLQMRSRQLDLDRIAVAPEVAPDTPRPSPAQWVAAFDSVIGASHGLGLPLSISADLGIDAITSGNLTYTDAAAVLQSKPDAPMTGRVSLAGPEGSRLTLDGSFELGTAPAFKGHAEVATRSLSSVVGWMAPVWPQGAEWIGSDPIVHAVDFQGGVTVSKVGMVARDMQLTLDGSTLGGTVSLTGGVASERPRLFADLTADRIDSSHLPDLSRFAAAVAPLDLSIGLATKAARFSGDDLKPIDAGQLSLHLTKAAGTMTIDQFSVTGFGGAAVTGTASIDPNKGLRAEGRVEASAVAPLAAVLRQIIPGGVTNLMAAHAGSLSPLNVAFRAEGTLDADGGLTPTQAMGEGSVGSVKLTASFTPEPAQKYAAPQLRMVVKADGADAGTVLRQWGLTGSTAPAGPFHLDLTAKGNLKTGFDAEASIGLPDAKASFAGLLGLSSGSGRVKASGASAVSFMRTAGLAAPAGLAATPWDAEGDASWEESRISIGKLAGHASGSTFSGALELRTSPPSLDAAPTQLLTGALTVDAAAVTSLSSLDLVPAPQTGAKDAGVWSKAKFGPMGSLPRAEIGLKIAGLDLTPGLQAREAGLTLCIAPGVVTLANLSGRLLGGTVGGTMTLRRDGPAASVAGQVSLSNIGFNLPSLAGRLTMSLDLAATGSSPDALMGSLAGEGSISFIEARMPRLNPDALITVAKTYDADGASVEDEGVRDALGAALDKGALALGDLTSAATLAAGTLRVAGLETKAATYSAVSEGSFDLRSMEMTVRSTVSSAQLPKDWKGDPPQVTVTWAGPYAAPVRTVDAAAFVNGLAARAIARDQERIELMQSDIRERAFFARRLKQIEAEQQAVRDAALIQKMVPIPPKPGDIRLPKPVDPTTGASPRPANGAKGADDITKLLNGLVPLQLAPPKPAPKTSNPPVPPTIPPNPNTALPDPTAAGRY